MGRLAMQFVRKSLVLLSVTVLGILLISLMKVPVTNPLELEVSARSKQSRSAPQSVIEDAVPVHPAPEARQAPDPGGSLRLPDGSYVPNLNGVGDQMVLNWPERLPFSPIVGRVTDSFGIERYLHADGSQSTTRLVYRRDLGRMDSMVTVSNPRPVAALRSAAGRRK